MHPKNSASFWRSPKFRILLLSILLLAVAGGLVFADWWSALPPNARASYVGGKTCAECHQKQTQLWEGSHHDLAMDLATPETVLGDFDDAEIEHFGVQSRLFRRGEKYMIHTEGPDGKMTDFEIKYVFGVDPLQQYMVEFDRPAEMPENEIARVQVLRIAWNTREKQWFYLPPPDVRDEKLDPGDDLHWTGVAQRWNNMCADCHSTNLKKNYHVETGIYHTTYSEIDVSCEACHGPGSIHVELAKKKSLFWDRHHGYGLAKLKGDTPEHAKRQIHTCAQCHSRRRLLHPEFHPNSNFYDHYDNELLREQTYHADGQILDEVYVHSSFAQSKMYHKGIRCTDCHDPHTAKLKHQGNQVCTSCHAHPAGKYDTPAHHQHKEGSKGAACVECHMPETTYMDVDPRRDHSLRIPRPDVSVETGAPNACTRCHLEEEKGELADRKDLRQYLDWVLAARDGDQPVGETLQKVDRKMSEAAAKWWKDTNKSERLPNFAADLLAARRNEPDAEAPLRKLAQNARMPAIVRATAVMESARYGSSEMVAMWRESLEDENPQVRAAAAANFFGRPSTEIIKTLSPLLDDPVRLVRVEAARVLASVPLEELRGGQRERLMKALAEYEDGVLLNSDRAAAHVTLGIMNENLGREAEAIRCYETAIRVEDSVTGPRTNLAALWDRKFERLQQQMQQAMRSRTGIQAGVLQEMETYRQKAGELRKEELKLLARDARLLPDNAPIQYRYGMALYLQQQLPQAEQALEKAYRLEPNQVQFAMALALFHQRLQNWNRAEAMARRWLELSPSDQGARQVLQAILQQRAQGPAPR